MNINIVTIFPELFEPSFTASILGRAAEKGLISIRFYNPRDYSDNPRRSIDAPPFGGGPGMIMSPAPLFQAVAAATADCAARPRVVLLSAQGRLYSQATARRLANEDALTIVCGRYGGVDERFAVYGADEEISVGDYILTGGEIPAMAIIDSVTRLLPSALGNARSVEDDSFSGARDGRLQGPVYTRPAVYRGWSVPRALTSGDHAAIAAWREEVSARRTNRRRRAGDA